MGRPLPGGGKGLIIFFDGKGGFALVINKNIRCLLLWGRDFIIFLMIRGEGEFSFVINKKYNVTPLSRGMQNMIIF